MELCENHFCTARDGHLRRLCFDLVAEEGSLSEEVDDGMGSQLLHDIAAMHLHRPPGSMKGRCDFTVGFPMQDEMEDDLLGLRQGIRRCHIDFRPQGQVRRRKHEALVKRSGEAILRAGLHCSDGSVDLTGFNQYDDRHPGRDALDLAQQFEPFGRRFLDVGYEKEASSFVDGLQAIGYAAKNDYWDVRSMEHGRNSIRALSIAIGIEYTTVAIVHDSAASFVRITSWSPLANTHAGCAIATTARVVAARTYRADLL